MGAALQGDPHLDPTHPTDRKASLPPGAGPDPGPGQCLAFALSPPRKAVGWGAEERAPLSHPPAGPPRCPGERTDRSTAHPGCFEAAGARPRCQGFVRAPPLRLRGSGGVTTGPPAAFEELGRGCRKWAAAHPGPGPAPPEALSPCPPGGWPGPLSWRRAPATLRAQVCRDSARAREAGAAGPRAPQPLGPNPRPGFAPAPAGEAGGPGLGPSPSAKNSGLGFVESPRQEEGAEPLSCAGRSQPRQEMPRCPGAPEQGRGSAGTGLESPR